MTGEISEGPPRQKTIQGASSCSCPGRAQHWHRLLQTEINPVMPVDGNLLKESLEQSYAVYGLKSFNVSQRATQSINHL